MFILFRILDFRFRRLLIKEYAVISNFRNPKSAIRHVEFYPIIATALVHPALPPFILAGKQATLNPDGGN